MPRSRAAKPAAPVVRAANNRLPASQPPLAYTARASSNGPPRTSRLRPFMVTPKARAVSPGIATCWAERAKRKVGALPIGGAARRERVGKDEKITGCDDVLKKNKYKTNIKH